MTMSWHTGNFDDKLIRRQSSCRLVNSQTNQLANSKFL